MRSLKRAFQAVWALAALLVLPATLACGGGHSSPPPPTPPSITTQPASQTVLEGATATFSVVAAGSTPFTYQWNKGGTAITGATTASYTTPATVLADSGSSFTVTVTNSAGNVTSSAATLTVYPNPTITSFTAAAPSGSPAAAITMTNGDTATLAFVFSGGTGTIDNGVGTVTSGTNVTVTPITTTTYTLTVDNGHSTTKTATVTVTVVPAPATPTITAPANVTLGGTYTASVVAQAGMTYTWTATNGTITAGQGTNQISFTAGASGTAMSLGCVVANAAGATASGSMNMTMVIAPVATSLTPSTATPLYGATVTLIPVFTGGTGSVDNGIGTVMTGTSYPTAALKAATTFTLTVTNMAGTTATTATTVTPKTVTVSVSPTTKTVTTGDVVTFTGSAANAVNTAVTWTASGGASVTSAGVWTAPSAPGSYTVTATSVADPTKSATATMTVVAPPIATITPSATTLSTGKTGTASVPTQATGTTYLWSATGATITSAINAASVTFTTGAVGSATLSCTVTNAASLPKTGTSTITVVALPTASLSTNALTPPLYGATTVTITPTFANATSAKVGTTQGGSDISSSATSGTALPVQASGFTAATTYWVRATNAAGDYVDASVAIAPQTVTMSSITGGATNLTVSTSATYSATVSGAVNTTVNWLVDGVAGGNATAGTITSGGVYTAPASAGSHIIEAVAAADNKTNTTLSVNIYSLPDATITATTPVSVGATGLTASVPLQSFGTTYTWTLTNGSITAGQGTRQITFTAGSAGSLGLTCVVTNPAGTPTTGNLSITVVTAPVVNSFSASPTGVVSGGAVTLSYNFANGTGLITGSDGYTSSSLTAGIGTVTVNPTSTPSVTYTLTVTGTGPNAFKTATVSVSTPLKFTTDLPTSGTANVGTNYTMSVVVTGTPAANSYDWYFNGSKVTTTTTPSYTISNVQTSNAGNWYVVASNGITTATSATLALTVSTGYTISGHVYLVNSGSTGAAGVEVLLSQGSTILTRSTTDNAGYYSFPFLANGTYTVTPTLVASGVSAGFLPASSSVSVSGSSVTADFQAAIGYSVSGTVNYGGSKTGRVYLVLNGNNGNVYGVSILGPTGGYTIRGVPPGTYTLTAYMDTVGLGVQNAENPVVTVTGLGVTTASVTGIAVNLADPAAVTLSTAPAFQGIVPFNGGALVNYGPLTDGSGLETPNAYELQWSTDSTFATGVGSLVFKAQGSNNPMCFASGMTNGSTYYFRIRGKAGTATISPWSATSSKVIGAATGFNTVTGTITLPVAATGPLAVALVDKANNKFFIVSIPKASITNLTPTYTLTGVPNGTYGLYCILDQNANGVIDPGDITNTGGNGMTVTVSGNLANQNLTLSGANAKANVTTSHSKQGTNDYYQLNFQVRSEVQLPVNVALNFGTTANPAFVDVGVSSQNSRYQYWMPWIRPTVGDAYPLTVAYSNTAIPTDTLTTTVTGVVDAFAQTLTVNTATGTLTPTFNWVAPVAPPTPYTYEVGIWPQFSGGSLWWINGLPSTTTSILFNSDGSASGPLVTGTAYTWTVNVDDQYGNNAQVQMNYTP